MTETCRILGGQPVTPAEQQAGVWAGGQGTQSTGAQVWISGGPCPWPLCPHPPHHKMAVGLLCVGELTHLTQQGLG